MAGHVAKRSVFAKATPDRQIMLKASGIRHQDKMTGKQGRATTSRIEKSPIPLRKGRDGSDSEIVYPVLYRFGDSRYQKICDRGLPAVSGPFGKESRSERIKVKGISASKVSDLPICRL